MQHAKFAKIRCMRKTSILQCMQTHEIYWRQNVSVYCNRCLGELGLKNYKTSEMISYH